MCEEQQMFCRSSISFATKKNNSMINVGTWCMHACEYFIFLHVSTKDKPGYIYVGSFLRKVQRWDWAPKWYESIMTELSWRLQLHHWTFFRNAFSNNLAEYLWIGTPRDSRPRHQKHAAIYSVKCGWGNMYLTTRMSWTKVSCVMSIVPNSVILNYILQYVGDVSVWVV